MSGYGAFANYPKKVTDVVTALASNSREFLKQHPDHHFRFLREHALSTPELKSLRQDQKQTIESLQQDFYHLVDSLVIWGSASDNVKMRVLAQLLLDDSDDCIVTNSDAISELIGRPKVVIIGAGMSGLLAALLLARQHVDVVIYEAREEISAKLRPQNISFKEAELRLKAQLGEDLYNECFNRGGALDGNTGKLRLTIGCFQEILLEGLGEYGVPIHYGCSVTPQDCVQREQPDIVLLAAGFHSCAAMQLEDILQPICFPDYSASGASALFLSPTQAKQGYFRGEGEGYNWYRENKTIYSGQVFSKDIQRLVDNPKSSFSAADQAGLVKQQSVDYTFTFGNDTQGFQAFIDAHPQSPVLTWKFSVEPMLTQKIIYHLQQTPVLVIGDANGSAHPLAAIGTLKFIRNMSYLGRYVYRQKALDHLSQLHVKDAKLADELSQLIKINNQVYQMKTLVDSQQVLFENILSCMFSEKRVTEQ